MVAIAARELAAEDRVDLAGRDERPLAARLIDIEDDLDVVLRAEENGEYDGTATRLRGRLVSGRQCRRVGDERERTWKMTLTNQPQLTLRAISKMRRSCDSLPFSSSEVHGANWLFSFTSTSLSQIQLWLLSTPARNQYRGRSGRRVGRTHRAKRMAMATELGGIMKRRCEAIVSGWILPWTPVRILRCSSSLLPCGSKPNEHLSPRSVKRRGPVARVTGRADARRRG